MKSITALNLAQILPALATAFVAPPSASSTTPARKACSLIQNAISNFSAIYYAPSTGYQNGIEHYFTSSMQSSTCSVEVGSTADTVAVMKIINKTKARFAVKSGGHSSNRGFSSTPGVQISMTRMNQVSLSKDTKTVLVGMGNTWTDVYTALNGTGYNVVGGRVDGPGTGGFTLGGGYSWLTNQYGLSCDNALEYTLVLPNASVQTISSKTPDLFFALKGGLNLFGIVTEITYRAVPQPSMIYAGLSVFNESSFTDLLKATTYFDNYNTDPKAQVILTFDATNTSNSAILLIFYDGPTRPAALDPFNSIAYVGTTVKTQSFLSFAKETPSYLTAGKRGAYHSMSTVSLTANFLKACVNETQYYATLTTDPGVFISYDIEPFINDYGKHAVDSAFPHANSPRPLNLYFAWTQANEDGFWRTKMKESVAHLIQVAKSEGIYSEDLAVYPNYVLSSTNVTKLYLAKNLARLKAIKAIVDPHGIMELAGGFTL